MEQEIKRRKRAVDTQMRTCSPCPKCGGKCIDTHVYQVGLEDERSIAIVCLSCGYVELYVKPEALENIKRLGSVAAGEYSAALSARRAELDEQLRQAEQEAKKRRFFFF